MPRSRLLWALMNIGVSFTSTPTCPLCKEPRTPTNPGFALFLQVTSGGWLVIASFWAALTLVWWLLRAYRTIRPELDLGVSRRVFHERGHHDFASRRIVLGGGAAQIGVAGIADHFADGRLWLAHTATSQTRPMYSRARPAETRAILRRGKRNPPQLGKTESDFDGWLMLAELHATRFKELAEAEQIILDTCLQAEATPSQISVALHKLADWQISLAADPEAAARTLKLISIVCRAHIWPPWRKLRRAQLPNNREFRNSAKPSLFPWSPFPACCTD